jgi:uncharacterized protein YdaU (DUF1376 family)
MKFYSRFPDNFMSGTAELTLEQIGAYTLLIDLLYSRDGIVPDDDVAVAHMIYRDPRTWRAMKKQLMAAGKVRITNEGLLTANGVDAGLSRANLRSEIARKAVRQRWDRFRLAKKNNDPSIRTQYERYTTKTKTKSSELPSPIEHAKPLAVDNVENSNAAEAKTTTSSIGTAELRASLKAKGWL